MNGTSNESRRLTLKSLATRKTHQYAKQLKDTLNDPPEPHKRPDEPVPQAYESPSVEPEGQCGRVARYQGGPTRVETDMLVPSESGEDARK
jgi:hypothetical protein